MSFLDIIFRQEHGLILDLQILKLITEMVLEDDSRFAKYVKMLKMGIPEQAVKNAMRQAGLNPYEHFQEILDSKWFKVGSHGFVAGWVVRLLVFFWY